MMPGMQISTLLLIQLYSCSWTYKIVVKESAFIQKTTGASQLLTESALSLFLLIGMTFYVGGGADKFSESTRVGLQWIAIVSIGLSCMLSTVDLIVGLYRSISNFNINRKIRKFRKEQNRIKEE